MRQPVIVPTRALLHQEATVPKVLARELGIRVMIVLMVGSALLPKHRRNPRLVDLAGRVLIAKEAGSVLLPKLLDHVAALARRPLVLPLQETPHQVSQSLLLQRKLQVGNIVVAGPMT
ncbi:hypothetical protein RRF57_006279 [Xylaria bambusicola]|uniref:Uncharacterized protein n=1 Tax=Xylaria bambusicola TaxID=326684 RepID=A0AAN7UNI2_9PEZI